MRLPPRAEPLVPARTAEAAFSQLVAKAFTMRRKTMRNSLRELPGRTRKLKQPASTRAAALSNFGLGDLRSWPGNCKAACPFQAAMMRLQEGTGLPAMSTNPPSKLSLYRVTWASMRTSMHLPTRFTSPMRGPQTITLQNRHWIITHGDGNEEEVVGDGVVGETPELPPGARFTYTSGAFMPTRVGSMQGSYGFVTQDGEQFPRRDTRVRPAGTQTR